MEKGGEWIQMESAFILKHCHLFLHMKKSPPPPPQRRQPSQGDLWGVKHQWMQVQTNCSIEGGKLKGIMPTSKEPIGKKQRKERERL